MEYIFIFCFYSLLMLTGAFVSKCIERRKKNLAIIQRRQRAMRQYTVPSQRKGN